MPLHDWSKRAGWEGVRQIWITELLRCIKPQLPPGFRAHIGAAPLLAIGASGERPDVSVRQWPEENGFPAKNGPAAPGIEQPDEEIAVATLDPATGVYVEVEGRLVSALELVSPRNKDRPLSREGYLARYLGYLLGGVHLLLVDVHRRPAGFSFPDRIAKELQMEQPSLPPPMAVSYRAGEPAPAGGRLLALWRRPLSVGQAMPTLPLALSPDQAVTVNLEGTYQRAAEDAYLT